jgi:hypothetical protein
MVVNKKNRKKTAPYRPEFNPTLSPFAVQVVMVFQPQACLRLSHPLLCSFKIMQLQILRRSRLEGRSATAFSFVCQSLPAWGHIDDIPGLWYRNAHNSYTSF